MNSAAKPASHPEENLGQAAAPADNSTTRMTVTASYNAALAAGNLLPDAHQKKVVDKLQLIADALLQPPVQPVAVPSASVVSRVFSLFQKDQPVVVEPLVGLYVWGGVGRGKTHVADMFYESLPMEQKFRVHFHRFMQLVHGELKKLKNVSDPLESVAKTFSARFKILCLDEMHIFDITDAMLVGELFRHLFEQGVTLVTTSNVPPNGLYKDGLQRDRFLPAIGLLERYTEVIHIGGDTDYRLRALEQAETWLDSSAADAGDKLDEEFHALVGMERHVGSKSITINDRDIPVVQWEDGIAWFRFADLCDSPRSTADYIEIAEYFHTVVVESVPIMDKNRDDAARRFVNLIDEFYDRNVNLIASAKVAPERIYSGERLEFEFVRTASRLREMQSTEYLHQQHLSD